MTRPILRWCALALAGLVLLPWYALDDTWSLAWIRGWTDAANAPALLQVQMHGRTWLGLLVLPFIGVAVALGLQRDRRAAGSWLIGAGLLGLAIVLVQGLVFRHPNGTPGGWPTQPGMGYGALFTATAFLLLLCRGFAARGACRGDAFVTSSIGVLVALIAVFVFAPVLMVLRHALLDEDGGFSVAGFAASALDASIWQLDCLIGGARCGVAWNTLALGVAVGIGTTLLGFAFALVASRMQFRGKGLLRVIGVLPIITPPFMLGLALILLFGRSGAVSTLLYDLFGIPRTRWIYGFTGTFIAQLLAFTPIAFLVLVGVVQGISPSLEEASQTLRARGWTTFRTVTWPLARPGLANCFLLGFVESVADFGNPLLLAGSFEVLSVKVFFAIVGAAHDQGKAAGFALVLLLFTLLAFWAQQRWLGRAQYTGVTGKGDSGLPAVLPRGLRWLCASTVVLWSVFTIAVYATIGLGGFVKSIGRDHTFTLEHFATAFSWEWGERGLHLTGSAWDSLITTLGVAGLSAPLTAIVGLLTAYLLARQDFSGKRAFEFATLLSFAIPGTVIGVSYVLAFNAPPVELTGTGVILVLCFVFRNMPVGVRAGVASMSQIDRSLDEASIMLRAGAATTMRRVMMPLLKPAIIVALVSSFARSMMAVSAVIFLVSAQYNMATAYIVGRVEAGEFGLAIAYSCALIAIMVAAIGIIQWVVGERRLGRRESGALVFQGGG